VREREAELCASEAGRPPSPPENPPALLAIGLDGGRIQMREADPESGSRWREDKVAAVTTYLPGDGAEREPAALATSYMATLSRSERFGQLARVEAERRGLSRAEQVLILADGGSWIDPVAEREFPGAVRILDWYHASEHLHDCARAIHGPESPKARRRAERWKRLLWDGQVEAVVAELERARRRLGPPPETAGPEDPRRVLAGNAAYFRQNRAHLDYPTYRRRGWPVGSGNVESGIKQFNKRVKGTEQFWQPPGAEAILALRSLWISQDDRWPRYWRNRPAYREAA
jgi:hypothetical protein